MPTNPEDNPLESIAPTREWGWMFASDPDSDRVWNDLEYAQGWLILHEDGSLDSWLADAREDIQRAESTLWQRLGPVVCGDVGFTENARFYHHDREEWIQARTIDIDLESVEPVIEFKIQHSEPPTYIKLWGSDIEELRDDGVLETPGEMHNRLDDELGADWGDDE